MRRARSDRMRRPRWPTQRERKSQRRTSSWHGPSCCPIVVAPRLRAPASARDSHSNRHEMLVRHVRHRTTSSRTIVQAKRRAYPFGSIAKKNYLLYPPPASILTSRY
jgi:hypothetical protein